MIAHYGTIELSRYPCLLLHKIGGCIVCPIGWTLVTEKTAYT